MRPITVCLVIVLVSAIALVTGCGGGDSSPSTLSGTVVDAGTLQPLANASVVVTTGVSTVTDATGFFFFDSFNPGVSSVSVAAPGYVTQVVNVPAGGGDKSVGTVFLTPAPVAGTGNVTGIITEGGVAAANAVITSGGRTARSRSDGVYVLYNVPAGFQTVQVVNAAGTMGGSKNVSVSAASTVTADIPLTTSPPPPPPG